MDPRQIIKSPVRSLFSNNEEPTEEQRGWILDTIRSVEADMDLNILESPEARSRHQANAWFCNMHRSLLSPARRVPYDIWDIIIRLAVQNNMKFGFMDCTSRIGSVCRLWNVIAKSIPELATILPPIRFKQKSTINSVLSLDYANRVSSLPSSALLSVHFPGPITVSTNSQFMSIAQLPEIQRWERLSITMTPNALARASLSPTHMSHPMVNLRHLRIYVHPGQKVETRGECFLFCHSPSLKHVEVESIEQFLLPLPWDQITDYKEVSDTATIGINMILLSNEVLESLEYRHSCPDVVIGRHLSSKKKFRHLKSLDIRAYNNTHPQSVSLLDRLIAPTLQTLRVRDRGSNVLTSLVDFITVSTCGPTLSSLILDTYKMESGMFMRILGCTPLITHLECNDIPLTSLHMLSMKNGRGKDAKPTFVPHLRNLVVHSPSFVQNLDELAKDRSRMCRNPFNAQSEPSSILCFSVKLVFLDRKRFEGANKVLFQSGEELESARIELVDTLCELDIQGEEIRAGIMKDVSLTWRTLFGRKPDPGVKMDDIFKILGDFPIERMPEAMPWAIHVLERFILVLDRPDIAPRSITKSKFNDLCKSLLPSWKYLLKRQTLSKGWILLGRLCLQYVGDAHNPVDTDYNFTEDKDTFWGDCDFSENRPIGEYIAWRRRVNFD